MIKRGKYRLAFDSEHIMLADASLPFTTPESNERAEPHKSAAENCRGARAAHRRLTQMPLHGQQLQTKTNIKFAAVMGAATGETCDCAPDLPYAREIVPAIRATVDETRRITLRWKRQRMTALFVRDSQIPTSLLPLRAVRRNLPPMSSVGIARGCEQARAAACDQFPRDAQPV